LRAQQIAGDEFKIDGFEQQLRTRRHTGEAGLRELAFCLWRSLRFLTALEYASVAIM
jgi:hypothetical protein